jgi:HTH-type transcriptional regulator/antitoxin HigA
LPVKTEVDEGVGQRYMELIRENPLRILRSDDEYARAIAILDRLSNRGTDRSHDETEYLLALAVFVERYETEQNRSKSPASGIRILRSLIESRGTTPSQVAAGSGLGASTLSDLLAGRRKLTSRHIAALARFFGVEPEAFLRG